MRTRQCARSELFGRTCAFAKHPRQQYAGVTCQRTQVIVAAASDAGAWGDSGADEGPAPVSETNLSFDVMGSVGKVLTAKAVQHVLAQLGETDLIVAQWLNNFAADTSPLLGDEFIMKLMKEAPSSVVNPSSGSKHHVNPQQLGNRVILMRAELSKSVATTMVNHMNDRNMKILRQHLEATSYISGSSEGKKRGDGYRRGGEGNSRSRYK